MKGPLPKNLFNILACPACKASLTYNKLKTKLVCTKCKKQYDIKEDIPILLP